MNELDLGKEKINRLIAKFSVPCVISMVVAALYNIVDQIFIGWSEAGAFGNAATNIVYPFTVLALGLALLIGDGAASGFSIALGMNEKKSAEKFVGNGLAVLVSVSVILCIIGFIFRKGILSLFGANPAEELCYQYAADYFFVICAGLPFYMIGQGLNGSIRADGSPKYAMSCTLSGAIANLILDPVFIFMFGMGVKGAAIATVIGQIITFGMSVTYLFRPKQFKISRESLCLDLKVISKIASVGMASLLVQLSIVIIIAVHKRSESVFLIDFFIMNTSFLYILRLIFFQSISDCFYTIRLFDAFRFQSRFAASNQARFGFCTNLLHIVYRVPVCL